MCDTRRSETSQYPKEKKAKAIPSVVASESGTAQTGGIYPDGVAGPRHRISGGQVNGLESPAIEGDRPVTENQWNRSGIPSSTMHVKLRVNLCRPRHKAKYSMTTDSELVPRGKGEKHPC